MARIYESDIPLLIETLQQYLAASTTSIPTTGITAEEIDLLREHRRQKQLKWLENKGIEVTPMDRPAQVTPTQVATV